MEEEDDDWIRIILLFVIIYLSINNTELKFNNFMADTKA